MRTILPDIDSLIRGIRAIRVRLFALTILTGTWLNPAIPSAQVLTGIDVLQNSDFATLAGQRVGLITNHTGLNRTWDTTIEILVGAENVDVVALFSPEHGIRGTLDTWVASGVDSATQLPVHSLYSRERRSEDELYAGIETLVFDIQDIGARFYTYIATMKNCMQAAAARGIRFVVLDRPNPINGVQVEGPVIARDQLYQLGGIFPMPIRHGMTVGELAMMFNAEDAMGVDLHVVKMRGWRREMWFDQTGLPWINPSPNMKNLYEAALYPGLGLLERLNVANKRGLWRPFEEFGAPWIDGVAFAAELNNRRIPGVYFVPLRFVPTDHKYIDEPCEGVAVTLADRDALPSVRLGIEVVHALQKLYPDDFEIDNLWHMTRDRTLISQIREQVPVGDIVATWESGLAAFTKLRGKFLIYR